MLSVNMELARVPLLSKHHMSHLDRADIRATLVFWRLYGSLPMNITVVVITIMDFKLKLRRQCRSGYTLQYY